MLLWGEQQVILFSTIITLLGYFLGTMYEEKVLAIAAGGFLYLSLGGLIPELKS